MGQLDKSYSNKVVLRNCRYLVAVIHCAIFLTILFDKILYQLQIIFTMIRQTTSSAHVVSSNIAMYMYLALENSWCFVTPPVVSPQTNMTSEEWLQKFHTLMTGNYPDMGSVTSSIWNFCSHSSDVIFFARKPAVVASQNVGCFLSLTCSCCTFFTDALEPYSLCIMSSHVFQYCLLCKIHLFIAGC